VTYRIRVDVALCLRPGLRILEGREAGTVCHDRREAGVLEVRIHLWLRQWSSLRDLEEFYMGLA